MIESYLRDSPTPKRVHRHLLRHTHFMTREILHLMRSFLKNERVYREMIQNTTTFEEFMGKEETTRKFFEAVKEARDLIGSMVPHFADMGAGKEEDLVQILQTVVYTIFRELLDIHTGHTLKLMPAHEQRKEQQRMRRETNVDDLYF